MPKTYELRDLQIRKIALVRKGFRPVNDGARITIVKAEQEDRSMSERAVAEASVLERISKGLAKLITGEDSAADVEKANNAKIDAGDMNFAADGSHPRMTGKHSHEHAAFYAMQSHGHMHEHDNDGDHYHGHVLKAEDAGLPDGWTLVSHDDLVKMLAAEPVAKAEPPPELTAQLEQVSKALEDSKAKAEELQKAIPTDEHIAELVNKALEPIAKSIEDLAVAFSRQPRTPNVTTQIRPDGVTTNGTQALPDDVKGDFSAALRYLTDPARNGA